MDKDSLVNELQLRMNKYSAVLKSAEDENNSSKVRRYKRIVAQYNNAIKDTINGKRLTLTDLPNPPGFSPLVAESSNAKTAEIDEEESADACSPETPHEISVIVTGSPDELNLIDELTTRLENYSSVLKEAECEGVASKIRRYKRIVAQFTEAINAAKAGKEVQLADLPNPPGFKPLITPQPSPNPSPTSSPLPGRADLHQNRTPTPSPQPVRRTLSPLKPNLTRAEKQTTLLRSRQKEFKDAAIKAKKAGQIDEAKEFLKIYKGFDKLIQASEGGLPVDISTIPASPSNIADVEDDFVVVVNEDFDGKSSEGFEVIRKELSDQIKTCMQRSAQFRATGDVANANRFENFALTFKKDLNNVSLCQSSSLPLPKFHFEQRTFSIVQCFSEIAAGDLELSIVQAVNFPKAYDSYVGYEFPYPSENPPSGYTAVVKNSTSPKFESVINFGIDRDSKQCQRVLKRHGIKFQVWAKGGLFHRDISLGTVVVKLLPLANNIIIHDAFDILNGRRPTGAKLEVKIRVRDPLVTKKIDTITEKWLVLD